MLRHVAITALVIGALVGGNAWAQRGGGGGAPHGSAGPPAAEEKARAENAKQWAADIEKRTGECFERGDGPNRGEKKRDEVGAEASRVAQHSRHVADLRAGVHPIMLPKAPQRFGKLRINTYGMELSLGA